MGLFSNWKKSAAKSKLMQTAAMQVQSGELSAAVEEIYEFLHTDEAFVRIIDHFKAKTGDIESIITGLMLSGAGVTVRGHYIPVSTVLFHDTLAYMLRAERGQVQKTKAFYEILEYFQSGAIVFHPERQFH